MSNFDKMRTELKDLVYKAVSRGKLVTVKRCLNEQGITKVGEIADQHLRFAISDLNYILNDSYIEDYDKRFPVWPSIMVPKTEKDANYLNQSNSSEPFDKEAFEKLLQKDMGEALGTFSSLEYKVAPPKHLKASFYPISEVDPKWTCGNGRKISPKAMEDSHLKNTIMMLRRKGYIEKSLSDQYKMKIPSKWLDIFMEEVRCREAHWIKTNVKGN